MLPLELIAPLVFLIVAFFSLIPPIVSGNEAIFAATAENSAKIWPAPTHGITRAFVIALDPASPASRETERAVRRIVAATPHHHHHKIMDDADDGRVTMFKAYDAEFTHSKLDTADRRPASLGHAKHMSLFTRHVIEQGARSDHMQLGNWAAVGCLISHAEIWRRIVAGGVPAFVFEEDIVVTPGAAEGVNELVSSLAKLEKDDGKLWTLLSLDPGHLNSDGPSVAVGPLAARCANNSQEVKSPNNFCTLYGTRAYIITPAAAAVLLDYVSPITVQVDALITLVMNRADKEGLAGFKMLWTKRRIFPMSASMRPSTVYDGCVKCYFPSGIRAYVAVVFTIPLLGVLFVLGAWAAARVKNPRHYRIMGGSDWIRP
jgi:GR25 family glycosyltransferase involved in LPS biosynthesis